MHTYNICTIFAYFQHSCKLDWCLYADNYSVGHCTSYQVLRLIAFCTCLIRLLGAAFSTLRLSRYKEFIKQVGRTIR